MRGQEYCIPNILYEDSPLRLEEQAEETLRFPRHKCLVGKWRDVVLHLDANDPCQEGDKHIILPSDEDENTPVSKEPHYALLGGHDPFSEGTKESAEQKKHSFLPAQDKADFADQEEEHIPLLLLIYKSGIKSTHTYQNIPSELSLDPMPPVVMSWLWFSNFELLHLV